MPAYPLADVRRGQVCEPMVETEADRRMYRDVVQLLGMDPPHTRGLLAGRPLPPLRPSRHSARGEPPRKLPKSDPRSGHVGVLPRGSRLEPRGEPGGRLVAHRQLDEPTPVTAPQDDRAGHDGERLRPVRVAPVL